MRRLLIVQQHPAEGPGRIAAWAARRGVEVSVVRADSGLPHGGDAGIVLLGGPASMLAPPRWLEDEVAWVQRRVAGGCRVLGICLGAQVLATAMGVRVRRLSHAELGWTPVRVAGLASPLQVLQWHEDAFDLPPGAQTIAEGDACRVQGYAAGRVAGLQFHPEWDAAVLASLRAHFGALPFDVDDADPPHERVAAWLDAFLDDCMAA